MTGSGISKKAGQCRLAFLCYIGLLMFLPLPGNLTLLAQVFIRHLVASGVLISLLSHDAELRAVLKMPTGSELLKLFGLTVVAFISSVLLIAFLVLCGLPNTTPQMLVEMYGNADTLGIILGILSVAVLAPIGEELAFRFGLFHWLSESLGYKRGAWIASLVFGAIHFQLLQFIPLVLLGYLFQRVYFWRTNLVHAIFCHGLLNAISVILYFLGAQYGA